MQTGRSGLVLSLLLGPGETGGNWFLSPNVSDSGVRLVWACDLGATYPPTTSPCFPRFPFWYETGTASGKRKHRATAHATHRPMTDDTEDRDPEALLEQSKEQKRHRSEAQEQVTDDDEPS